MSNDTATIPGFYAVIPAGGIGSRLWPLSRADAPKFLHDLTGSGQTLLRDTQDRLAPLAGADRIMVVTGRAHRAAVEAQLPELADLNVVLESEPKDSSAAIGLAAAILLRREPDVVIGSFAADHVIRDTRAFRRAVQESVAAASAGYIATIGITPTEPAVGFGYIHCGDPLTIEGRRTPSRCSPSSRSPTSRPPRPMWPTGCTCGTAACSSPAPTCCWRRSAARTPPCSRVSPNWPRHGTPRRGAVVDKVWPGLTKIAIDYTVAEPAAAAGRLAVIPGDFDWDDVGDFASIAKLHSGGRKSDLAIWARTPGCSPMPRPGSSSAAADASSRSSGSPTSSSSTPRMPCS